MRSLLVAAILSLATVASASQLSTAPVPTAVLRTDPFPARHPGAPTGTAFAASIASLTDHERYAAAAEQILDGNVPRFLRSLVPVSLTGTGDVRSVTVFVTPDYLAVGTDDDFVPMPLDFLTASKVAADLGFSLPTTKIVDAVYAAAPVHLDPIPLPPGPEMRSMAYVLEHAGRIATERAGIPLGLLVAGDKKDVVLTGQLRSRPDREAIYGWHRPDGSHIQPLSLVHGVQYADYSHGIRLVADLVLVDGVATRYLDALADPTIAPLLSDEGPIPDAAALLSPFAP